MGGKRRVVKWVGTMKRGRAEYSAKSLNYRSLDYINLSSLFVLIGATTSKLLFELQSVAAVGWLVMRCH